MTRTIGSRFATKASDEQRCRLAAIDFTICEVWTRGGLVTYYILVVMELKTRKVEVAGITTNPNTQWITQVTRELTNHEDGFLHGSTHLILDRDTSFRPSRTYLNEFTHVKPVLLPTKSVRSLGRLVTENDSTDCSSITTETLLEVRCCLFN